MDVDVKLTEDNGTPVHPVNQIHVVGPQTATQGHNSGQLLAEAGGSQQEIMETGTQDGQATLKHGNTATLERQGGIHTGVVEETNSADIHMPILNSASQSKTTTTPKLNDIIAAVLQSKTQGVSQRQEGQAGAERLTQQNVKQPTVIFGTPVTIDGKQFLILSNPPSQGSHIILSNTPTQGSGMGRNAPSTQICIVSPTQTSANQTSTGSFHTPSPATILLQQTSTGQESSAGLHNKVTPTFSKTLTSNSKTKNKPPPAISKPKAAKVKKPYNPYPYCSDLGLDLNKRSHLEEKRDLKLLSNGVIKEVHHFANTVKSYFDLVVFDVLEKHFDLTGLVDSQGHKFSRNVSSKLIEMGKKWRQMNIDDRFEVFILPEITRWLPPKPICKLEIQAMAKNCAKYDIDPALPMDRKMSRLRGWLQRKRKYAEIRFKLNEEAGNMQFCKSLQKIRSLLDAWVYPDRAASRLSTSESPSAVSTLCPVEMAALGQNTGPADVGRSIASDGSDPQPFSLGPVEKESPSSSKVTGITQCPVEPATSVKNAGFTGINGRVEATPQSILTEPVSMEIDNGEVTLDPTGAEKRVVVKNELTDNCIKEEPDLEERVVVKNELTDNCIKEEPDLEEKVMVKNELTDNCIKEEPEEKVVVKNELTDNWIKEEPDFYPLYPSRITTESNYETDETCSSEEMSTTADMRPRSVMSEPERTVDNPYPICRSLGINLGGRSNLRFEKERLPVSKLTNALMLEIHDYTNEICSSSMQVASSVVKHYFNLDLQSEKSLQSDDFLNRIKQLMIKLRAMKQNKQLLLHQTFTFTEENETSKQTKPKTVVRKQVTNTAVLSPKYQRLKEISEKRRQDVQKKRELRASEALERTRKSKRTKLSQTDQQNSIPHPMEISTLQSSGPYPHHPASNQRAVPAHTAQLANEKPPVNIPLKEEQGELSAESLCTRYPRVVLVKMPELADEKSTINVSKKHLSVSNQRAVPVITTHEKPTINIPLKEEQEEFSVESLYPHYPVSNQRAVPVNMTQLVDEKPTINIPLKEEQGDLLAESLYPNTPESNQRAVPVKMTQLVDEKPTINIPLKEEQEHLSAESLYPNTPESVPVNMTQLVDEKPTINIPQKYYSVSNQRADGVSTTHEKPTINIPLKEEQEEFSEESLYPHYPVSNQRAVPVNNVTQLVDEKPTLNIPLKEEQDLLAESLYPNTPESNQRAAPVNNITQLVDEKPTINIPLKEEQEELSEESSYPHCPGSKQSAVPVAVTERVGEIHMKEEHEEISTNPSADLSLPHPGDPLSPYPYDSADSQVRSYCKMVLDVVSSNDSKQCPIFAKLATCVGPAAPDRNFKQILSDYRRDIVPYIDKYVYTDSEREKLSVVYELFCGIQLIEGLAYQAKMSLLLWEKMIFGERGEEDHGPSNTSAMELESRTVGLVKTVSDAVCPERDAKDETFQKFKAFFMSKGEFQKVPLVPLGRDRIAVVCHNAAGVYSIHDDLVEFTNNYSKDSSMCERIAADLEVQPLKAGCRALGLISMFVIDPLWRALTQEGNAGKMVPRYLTFINKLEEWQVDGRQVVEGSACLFDDIEIPKDLLFDKLTTWTESDFFELTVQIVELLLASLWTICGKMRLTYPGVFKPALPSDELRAKAKSMSERYAGFQRDIGFLGHLGSEEIGAIDVALESMIRFKEIRRWDWLQKRVSMTD